MHSRGSFDRLHQIMGGLKPVPKKTPGKLARRLRRQKARRRTQGSVAPLVLLAFGLLASLIIMAKPWG